MKINPVGSEDDYPKCGKNHPVIMFVQYTGGGGEVCSSLGISLSTLRRIS